MNNNKKIIKKPKWLKIKTNFENKNFFSMKKILKINKIITVCEEAACPNIIKCFTKGIATFMIMGNKCTRKCFFCNIKNGKPTKIDINEPKNIANIILKLKLDYVVITSVTRDDLKDGGAEQFAKCIKNIRKISPKTKIEILVPDFKKKNNLAIKILSKNLPDVINHNIETTYRLYKKIKPGGNYFNSLKLLKKIKLNFPNLLTKSGLIIGLGETDEEILNTIYDIKKNNVDILTIGQYLMPTKKHIPVHRYIKKIKFKKFKKEAYKLGFKTVISGPLVRSSYKANKIFKKKK
ncbi:lipoyl synthase [Candidatus Zinderia endosymbiont of Aphrophora alni]|uniref:lipoyl synthase n=1 Tax=Candidatus Zinderia endosymbiont of Aphrophora alni TaxID=3077951 RepID=UPI0030CA6E3F